jgi:phosphatidylglycerophosphate synthase
MWKLNISKADTPHLKDRFLGLSWVERRLREAKAFGESEVCVVIPEYFDENAIKVSKPAICAKPIIVHSDSDLSNSHYHSIPLMGLIEKHPPHRVRFPIRSSADYSGAKKFLADEIVRGTMGWVARNINKPISLAISRTLAETFITPNLWSGFNLIVGIASAFFVAQASYASVAFGGALFQLASIFDGVDGEIAKFRLESSRIGALIDTAVDNISLLAFLTGVGMHVFNYSSFEPSHLSMLVTVTAFSVVSLLVYVGYFVTKKLGSGSLASYDKEFLSKLPPADSIVKVIKGMRHLMKKDFFSFIFFVFCAFGWINELLVLAAVGPMFALLSVLYLNTRYSNVLEQIIVKAEADHF